MGAKKQQRKVQEAKPKIAPPQVQVLLEDGWMDFSSLDCKAVHDNMSAGTTKFAMQISGAMYAVEISGMEGTQTNVATKKTRKLRILESKDSSERRSSNPASGGA